MQLKVIDKIDMASERDWTRAQSWIFDLAEKDPDVLFRYRSLDGFERFEAVVVLVPGYTRED